MFHNQRLRNKIYECTKCCESPTERESLQYTLINFAFLWMAFGAVRRTAGVERNFPPTTTRICLPAWHCFLFSCHLRNNLRRAARNEHGEWSYPTREKTAWGCLIGGEGGRQGGETLNRCNSFSRTLPPAKPSAKVSASWLLFRAPSNRTHQGSCFFSLLPRSLYTRATFCRLRN